MKRSTNPRAQSLKHEGREKHGNDTVPSSRRSWSLSLLLAAGLVGASIVLSATVNPVFGRSVHWDWMAGLAPTLFLFMTIALRRRWV